jgi:hypothetical protein
VISGLLRLLLEGPDLDLVAVSGVGPDLRLVREPGTQTWAPVTFYALPTGEKYLHFGVRATPKV